MKKLLLFFFCIAFFGACAEETPSGPFRCSYPDMTIKHYFSGKIDRVITTCDYKCN
jgi:hypothetical protein